jgi:hypothetical protein
MKDDAKRVMTEIRDLYLSIGLLFAAGSMLAFALDYLLGTTTERCSVRAESP